MTPDLSSLLTTLNALEAQATKERWVHDGAVIWSESAREPVGRREVLLPMGAGLSESEFHKKAHDQWLFDSRLICELRNSFPLLRDHLLTLEREKEKYREAVARRHCEWHKGNVSGVTCIHCMEESTQGPSCIVHKDNCIVLQALSECV